MSGDIWIGAIAWLCGATCNVIPLAAVDLNEREIRLGDVVDLACVAPDEREAMAKLIIAEVPAATFQVQLSPATVKSLARRRVPGLTFATTPNDTQLVTLRVPAPERLVDQTPLCVRTTRAIPANTIILADMIERTACEPSTQADRPVYYDRLHGLPRAAIDLPTGAALGRLNAPLAAYETGDRLSLSIAVGAVRIAREVEAMQPAIAETNIFVRGADGEIFSSPTRGTSGEAPQ